MTKRTERNRRDPELASRLTMVGLAVLALTILTLGTHLLITTIQEGKGRVVTHG